MPCISLKSHTHTQTHQREEREERDLKKKKKDLLPSAGKNPAKKPLVPVCVQGVWGGKRKGGEEC